MAGALPIRTATLDMSGGPWSEFSERVGGPALRMLHALQRPCLPRREEDDGTQLRTSEALPPGTAWGGGIDRTWTSANGARQARQRDRDQPQASTECDRVLRVVLFHVLRNNAGRGMALGPKVGLGRRWGVRELGIACSGKNFRVEIASSTLCSVYYARYTMDTSTQRGCQPLKMCAGMLRGVKLPFSSGAGIGNGIAQ